jgi:hypothetical protein
LAICGVLNFIKFPPEGGNLSDICADTPPCRNTVLTQVLKLVVFMEQGFTLRKLAAYNSAGHKLRYVKLATAKRGKKFKQYNL